MEVRTLPTRCPSCGDGLDIVQLECGACGSKVEGSFEPCPICRLEGENRELFRRFLAARGNLKQVQRGLGLSYPTTRQRVEAMFRELEGGSPPPDPREVLGRLRSGEIDAAAAAALLRGDADEED